MSPKDARGGAVDHCVEEVIVIDPTGEQNEARTDEHGRVTILPGEMGDYAVRAGHVEPDRNGQRDGKPYESTKHYSTLTFTWPLSRM